MSNLCWNHQPIYLCVLSLVFHTVWGCCQQDLRWKEMWWRLCGWFGRVVTPPKLSESIQEFWNLRWNRILFILNQEGGWMVKLWIFTKMNECRKSWLFHCDVLDKNCRGAGYPSMPLLPGGVGIAPWGLLFEGSNIAPKLRNWWTFYAWNLKMFLRRRKIRCLYHPYSEEFQVPC